MDRLLLALAVGLLIAGAVGAEDPPRETFTDRLEVVEVLVDVVVTDAAGQPVLGLGREDFRVEEDGREAEVVSVVYHAYVDSEPELDRGGVAATTPPAPPEIELASRYFILFFHDLRRTDKETMGVLGQQLRAAKGARQWIEEELGPRDHVAVVGYDHKLRFQQDFTDDRVRLGEAIDRAVTRRPAPPVPGPPYPEPSLAATLPRGRDLRDATTSLRKALTVLARAAAPVEGRKHLILFSIGVGLPGSDRGLFDRDYVPTTIEALNDADVALYTIDLTPANAEHALSGALFQVAELTGGAYYQHVTSFEKPLRAVTRQLPGFYRIGYASSLAAGERGFRSFRVESRVPGLEVKSRQGYIYGD